MRMHKREAKDSCRCKIPILFETFKGKCRLSENELYFGTVFENQNHQINKEGFSKPDSDAKNGSQYHIVRDMGLYLCMNLLGTHRVILGHFMSFCPNYLGGLP